jgi:hypothetical protein
MPWHEALEMFPCVRISLYMHVCIYIYIYIYIYIIWGLKQVQRLQAGRAVHTHTHTEQVQRLQDGRAEAQGAGRRRVHRLQARRFRPSIYIYIYIYMYVCIIYKVKTHTHTHIISYIYFYIRFRTASCAPLTAHQSARATARATVPPLTRAHTLRSGDLMDLCLYRRPCF